MPWGWPKDNLQSAAVCGFGHNALSHILMCSSWPRASLSAAPVGCATAHPGSPLSHRAVSCHGLVADVLGVQCSWGSPTQHKGLLHCLCTKLGPGTFKTNKSMTERVSKKSFLSAQHICKLLLTQVSSSSPGIGVPIMLAYVYGVVPISLCRGGGCGVSTANGKGVKIEFDEDDGPITGNN